MDTSHYYKYKDTILQWRENHKEQYYDNNKKHVKKWREKNREQYSKKTKLRARRYASWMKISTEFFNILLEI